MTEESGQRWAVKAFAQLDDHLEIIWKLANGLLLLYLVLSCFRRTHKGFQKKRVPYITKVTMRD